MSTASYLHWTAPSSPAIDEGSQVCERTDLIRDFCAHCKQPEQYREDVMREKRERERVRRPTLLGKWFVASYPGRCSRCDSPFEPGDEIRADFPEEFGYISKQCHQGARARPEKAA